MYIEVSLKCSSGGGEGLDEGSKKRAQGVARIENVVDNDQLAISWSRNEFDEERKAASRPIRKKL